ncbi:MAG: hypothetical protein JXQ73_28785 [Phycisphaerae bacterium]|nr:hypothetical protein [Phycisphaerae bacterium]
MVAERRLVSGLLLAILSSGAAAFAETGAAGRTSQGLRLHFWDEQDVHDTYGKLVFRTEPLRDLGRAPGYPVMRFGCTAPREAGGWWVYGWSCFSDKGRFEPKSGMKVIRCWTVDGVRFNEAEEVFRDTSQAWLGFTNIVRRETDGTLFMFPWARDAKGHALLAYSSSDGKAWKLLASPAYRDHDAMCIIWDGARARLVNYQTTYQSWKKRYPDNVGGDIRRVISIRTSSDGVRWEPPGDYAYREDPWRSKLWTPDERDPEELEFYRMCVFVHQGRYVGLMCLYAPSPQIANTRKNTKHGPGLGSQWCFSRDGLMWSRPDRETDANAEVSYVPLQGAIRAGGMLRFYAGIEGDLTCGVSEDRIFCVFCRANGEFSSSAFEVPRGELLLNASANRYDSYVMVELQDEAGKVIPGFEREKCVLMGIDGTALPLQWGDRSAGELAGRVVRARVCFRDARIYGLHTDGVR